MSSIEIFNIKYNCEPIPLAQNKLHYVRNEIDNLTQLRFEHIPETRRVH